MTVRRIAMSSNNMYKVPKYVLTLISAIELTYFQ